MLLNKRNPLVAITFFLAYYYFSYNQE